jgi:uncharacterized phage protein gp47/JayE
MAFTKKAFQELYTRLEQEARQRAPELTDYQEGSVVRSLFESFAVEMATLYEQLDLVYRAGYVDTAEGASLDRVVAVLGIKRNEPDFATGEVTFTRDPGFYEVLVIPVGTLVTTVEDENQEQPKKAYLTIEEGLLAVGENTVTVKVQADTRGRAMACDANTVVVMPQPVPGIKLVNNNSPIRFLGRDRESDEELRQRAKQALLASGRASHTALENAVLSLPGVRAVRIREERSHPGVIWIYVDGLTPRNHSQVQQRIDAVRAAGIYVALEAAQPIALTVVLRIAVDVRVKGEERLAVERQVSDAVIGFISRVPMGEPLLFSQLTAEVLAVKGVVDLEDMRIVAAQPAAAPKGHPSANASHPAGEPSFNLGEAPPPGPPGVTRTTYDLMARRIQASLYQRFTAQRVRAATELKELPVDVQVAVTLPGHTLAQHLAAHYSSVFSTRATAAALLANSAVQALPGFNLGEAPPPGPPGPPSFNLGEASPPGAVLATLQSYLSSAQQAMTADAWQVGLPPTLQSALVATLRDYFAELQKTHAEGGGSVAVSEILAQLQRQQSRQGNHWRDAVQEMLVAHLQTLSAAQLADFPSQTLEAHIRAGAIATYQAAVRAAQTAQQTALNAAEEKFNTQTAEMDPTKDRAKINTAQKKLRDEQQKANERFGLDEAAAAATRDIGLTAAAAQVDALRTEAAQILQEAIVSLAAADADLWQRAPLYDLNVRLRARLFDGEQLTDVASIEASFVETPRPAILFAYATRVELTGTLQMTLPATTSPAEQAHAQELLRQAIANHLETLQPDQELNLDQLKQVVMAQGQVNFTPSALGLATVRNGVRTQEPDRNDGRKLIIRSGEKLFLAPAPWFTIAVEQ